MTPRRRLPRVGGAIALLAALAVAPAGRGAAADDLQPEPPRLFFADPDERARAQIDELIERYFGDVNKAVVGRDVLVGRFGLWSVPPLVERVRAGNNETIVRNSILTLGALRRTYGPSRFLWPAIPALTAVLRREGSDPWRRAFAALALGTFYGPETARRGPGSREGTRAGAEAATADLLEGNAALLKAVGDANGLVSAAASLALGKIGGMGVWGARSAQRRTVPLPASPEARVADLVATGLLPGDEDKALAEALRHEDRRVRAAAALAIACWAVAEGKASPSGALAADAAARARALDALLRPERNTLLRDLRDGAEAIFARAALALVADRVETFAEIYEVAVRAGDDEMALACAQGLLFAPRQSPVRKKLVDLLGRDGAGRVYKEPVIAAALMVAGTDGTDEGVEACRDYLKDRGKLPHGRVEWDVRFHGALGLVRALLAGRVSPAARPLAAQALVEAARAGLIDDPKREGRTFRDAVREVGRPFQAALATNPEAGPDPGLCARLEAAFDDPLALTARDPLDVAVDRLNDQLHVLYGLDALPKAAAGGPGNRTPSTTDQELRFLLGWLERYPYFTRLDLLRDRGRTEAPVRGRAGDDVFDVEVPR